MLPSMQLLCLWRVHMLEYVFEMSSGVWRGSGSHQVESALQGVTQDAVRLVDERRLLIGVLLLLLHGRGLLVIVRPPAEVESLPGRKNI